jgi:hypothetical protein
LHDRGLHQLGDRHGALDRKQERVTVGLGARRALGAGHAAGAGHVLDHDVLAELVAERIGDHAGDHVDAAAGCVGHDQRDRARRIGLRERGPSGREHDRDDHPIQAHCRAPGLVRPPNIGQASAARDRRLT